MCLRFVRRSSSVVGLFIVLSLLPAVDSPSAVAQQPQGGPAPAFSSSSVMFIENVGQFADGARFQVRGGIGTTWLAEDAIWITVVERSAADGVRSHVRTLERFDPERVNVQPDNVQRKAINIKLSFPGANLHPRLEPFDRLDTMVSYFIGNDPAQWQPDVPVWGGVRYVDLYPGVDLELTSESGQVVQRLAARPGADLDAVRLRVEGADDVAVDGDALRLSTAVGELTLPLLTLERANVERANVERLSAQTFVVAAPFALPNPQSAFHNPLSPADNPDDLFYGTFLGGGAWGEGHGIAVDGAGSAYVMGGINSSDFPTTPGAFDTTFNGLYDVFVAKLNATGSSLLYATFLGGGADDLGSGIAINAAGNAYVTGGTNSSVFDHAN